MSPLNGTFKTENEARRIDERALNTYTYFLQCRLVWTLRLTGHTDLALPVPYPRRMRISFPSMSLQPRFSLPILASK